MIPVKKKLFALGLALVMVLVLAACSGGSTTSTASPAPSAQTEGQESNANDGFEAYTFLVSDGAVNYAVQVNADMADVLAAMGEPQSYFEAESCAFKGLDKTYTYAGYVITTRPDGEKDFVNSILLTDDSVTTAEGIYIGSARADVTAAYGEAEGEAMLSYTKGDCVLNFIFDGDTVLSIEYLPA